MKKENQSGLEAATKPSFQKTAYQYALLICGSVLFPLAVNLFITPWNLNSGGIVGLCQIFSWLLCGSMKLTGLFVFTINIPLFILAYLHLSRSFVLKTLLSLMIQSILLSAVPVPAEPILPDLLSNVIFGAVIAGFGIGLCLQSAGSAGGLDILGVYFSKKWPSLSVGKLSYVVNAFVLGWAAILFSLQTALYSLIFVILMYFVCDRVHFQNINVYGFIITSNPQLKTIILEKTGRGVTWWQGKGAYTSADKEILLCMMNKYEVRFYRRLIAKADPQAFFLLSKGNPLLGNFEKRLID